MPYLSDEVERDLKYALTLWEKYFSAVPLYVIHGDLHDLNVLDDGEQYLAIDPCGFIAPIEFEYVRFIRNDVRNHPDFGYEERVDLMIHCFERFADKDKLIAAFIIDMAFCTYNSTFENIEMDEALLNLKIIDIAINQYR